MTNLKQLVRPLSFRLYTEDYKVSAESQDDQLLFDIPYYGTRLTGIGLPTTQRVTSASPFQHGETLITSLLEPRLFSLTVVMRDLWDSITLPIGKRGSRVELGRIINPGLENLRFEIVMTNGDVFFLQHVAVDTFFDATYGSAGDTSKDRTTIRFVAYDPVWYGTHYYEQRTISTENDAIYPYWSVTIPIENRGTWFSWPEIELQGAFTEATISMKTCNYDGSIKTTQGYVTMGTATPDYIIKTALPDRGVYEGSVAAGTGDRVAPLDALYNGMRLEFSPRVKLHEEQSEADYYANFVVLTASGCSVTSLIRVWYYDTYLAL
jgi:hypothetical protein